MKRLIAIICCFLLLQPAIGQQKKNKIITDSLAIEYFARGVFQDNILTLYALEKYEKLDTIRKGEVLNGFVKEFPGCQIVVKQNNGREIWLVIDGKLMIIDQWKADNLDISEFMPIDSKKKGSYNWFYYLGGMFSGSKWHSSGTLSLRAGTFLYKDKLDVGATSNLGYTKVGETHFVGELGCDSRWYLHYRLKKINLAPYAGTGISWAFAPEGYFEWRLVAGGCWFVGPGNIDFCLQYGTKSKLNFSVGYTFRPSFKKPQ